jgi:hypothetical protein
VVGGSQFRRGDRHCRTLYVLCGWQSGLVAPAFAEGSDSDQEFLISIQNQKLIQELYLTHEKYKI